MKKTILGLVSIGLIASTAQAQTPSWSGFKAGFSVDALTYTPTWIDTDFFRWGNNLSYSKQKLAPAIHVGWDTQTGALVYGVELDHTFASATRDAIYENPANGSAPSRFLHNELKSLTTLRGRMGMTTGSTLVYVTAGLAKATADHSFIHTTYAPDTFAPFHNDRTGFVYGFGVEQRVNPLLSLRAEYQSVDIPETTAMNPHGFRMEVGDKVSTFNFGASFHFGTGASGSEAPASPSSGAVSWSGFNAGLGFGQLDYTPAWTDTDYDWHGGTLAYSKRKLAPAIHVGWDTQVGSMVYGAELEHTFASATRNVIYDNPANGGVSYYFYNNELKSLTTLRGRMGLAVGNALVYTTAGIAKAQVDHEFLNNNYAGDTYATFHNDHTGFVYGFGVEQRVTPLVSLRAEYQHTDIPETMVTNPTGYRMEMGEDVSALTVGASFHFGAGDSGSAAPIEAPAQSWAGFKAGFAAGYLTYAPNWADTDYDWWDGNLSYPKRKIAPSIHVGWDDQIGSLVYGAELDHTFASAKRDVPYSNNIGANHPYYFMNNELKSVTTLRGRAGLAAGDGLVYVTAGFAKAQVDHEFLNNNPPTAGKDTFATFHNDHTGFVYGLGVEHRLTSLLSLRAEYLHVSIPETMAMNQYGDHMEVSDAVSTFNLGVSFHF